MTKILVADDEADLEALIKQKFRRQIREHKYEFFFALNGVEALQKVEQEPGIDIVLSDINMPVMDGLTLLNKLPELSHVGKLRETVQAIKENNILRMYVDETVLNFMNRREFETTLMANETVQATVAFVDICSFTSISENASADVVVKLLNSYFDVMVKEIIGQGGYIDKFIGDAVMAVFRGDYHLDKAIDACLSVREQIEKLPAAPEGLNFTPKVSIGISSGEMVSGNIGSASLRRLDYTVIGDVVNTAQRLQSAAKEGQIVIEESAYEKVKEAFQCRKVGEVILKNKRQPLVMYEVLS
jgi:adenylate cyclase